MIIGKQCVFTLQRGEGKFRKEKVWCGLEECIIILRGKKHTSGWEENSLSTSKEYFRMYCLSLQCQSGIEDPFASMDTSIPQISL